jgi:MFS family permease
MIKEYLSPFKNRDFSLLWFGQVISQFGERLTQMAIFGYVYQRFGGNPTAMANAKMIFFTLLPVFVVNPFAGVLVDRWGKRETMIWADFLRTIVLMVMVLVFLDGPIIMFVYIMLFLNCCVGRFFLPARQAIIPSIVSKDQIVMANSLITVAAMMSGVIGFGIGGMIVEWQGPKGGFVTNALTFAASGIFIWFISVRKKSEHVAVAELVDVGKKEATHWGEFVADIKRGIGELTRNESVAFSFRNLALLFSILGSLYIVFIVFIQKELGSFTGSVAGTKDLGFLAVWISLGLFISSVLYGRFSKYFDLARTVSVMFVGASVTLLLFALIVHFWHSAVAACVLAFFAGLFTAPVFIGCNSIIHHEGDEKVLGRLFSNLEMVTQAGFAICMFFTAFLADLMSPFVIILLVGGGVFVYSLYNLLTSLRNRSMDDCETEASRVKN